jgi:hypothetical protein
MGMMHHRDEKLQLYPCRVTRHPSKPAYSTDADTHCTAVILHRVGCDIHGAGRGYISQLRVPKVNHHPSVPLPSYYQPSVLLLSSCLKHKLPAPLLSNHPP